MMWCTWAFRGFGYSLLPIRVLLANPEAPILEVSSLNSMTVEEIE